MADVCRCLLCPICAAVVLYYLSSIAAPVLQWLVFVNLQLRDAGVYTNHLSLAAATSSSIGSLMGVLCAPIIRATEEQAAKICCKIFLLQPKVAVIILDICLVVAIYAHTSNSCPDCRTPGPSLQLTRNLLISALSLEVIASTVTFCVDCCGMQSDRNGYTNLN